MSDALVLALAAGIAAACSALVTWLLLRRFQPSQAALTRWTQVGFIAALVLLLVYLLLPESR